MNACPVASVMTSDVVHLKIPKASDPMPAMQESTASPVQEIIRLVNSSGFTAAQSYLDQQEANLQAMRYALQYDQLLTTISEYRSQLEDAERGRLYLPKDAQAQLKRLIECLGSELTRLGGLVPAMKDYAVTWG